MLDVIRKGQRWLTAIFVVGIGLVFAVFIGGAPGRPSRTGAVIAVGDQRVNLDEFYRMRERQEQLYADAFGESFDARKLRDTIDSNTANILVERTILAIEAERLGLTVAKQEVERSLLANPTFRDESGGFDREIFKLWIERNFGNERVFRSEQRRGELANKLIRVLNTQSLVSDAEARLAVEQRLEQVKLAFPILNPASAADDLERDEAAIAEYLASHTAEVQALYDERIDQYDVPEQAQARHILISVPQTAPEAEIEAKRATILEIRARIESGEDFAVVAEEQSDDPGSAANGGDLGWFRRGQMVAAFDEVAFSQEIGVLSEPVQSEFGFHLIRVEGRKEAQTQTLADVQNDLAFELMAREVGRERTRELAESLAAAVRSGQSLEDAARAADLTLERTNWVKRRPDGFVPGLGASPDLLATAFSLEAGASSDRIFEVGEQLALVQVLERETVGADDLEQQIAEERDKLRREKLETLIAAWIDESKRELDAAGELEIDFSLIN
jgi:peptidyl-prolyl cis-trans isomerase D